MIFGRETTKFGKNLAKGWSRLVENHKILVSTSGAKSAILISPLGWFSGSFHTSSSPFQPAILDQTLGNGELLLVDGIHINLIHESVSM